MDLPVLPIYEENQHGNNPGLLELSNWFPDQPSHEETTIEPQNPKGDQNRPYKNLPNTSDPNVTAYIRLLKLEDHKNPKAPLKGTLSVVNLTDSPDFAALSYVWGPYSSPKNTILCDNFPLEITTNCHEALLSLRKMFGAIDIWVDSICINQDDKEEKSTQIPLMEKIYMYASPTYIWLGAGNDATDRAVECIRLAARLRVPPMGVPWFFKGKRRTVGQDKRNLMMSLLRIWMSNFFCRFKFSVTIGASCYLICSTINTRTRDVCGTGLIKYSVISWFIRLRVNFQFNTKDFKSLLQTEWLERAWTYQEIILASDPVIVRGARYLEWQTLYQGLDFQTDDDKEIAKPKQSLHYWMRRYPRYELYSSISAPWRDLMMTWMRTPRPVSYNGITKRNIAHNKRETCSADTYFDEHIKNFLKWIRRSPYILPISFFIIPFILFITLALRHANNKTYRLAAAIVSPLILWLPLMITKPRELPLNRHIMILSDTTTSQTYEVIRVLRTRQATNPSDKSFAIQGILRRLGCRLLIPNYELDLGRVYFDLYKQLLDHDSYLISLLADSGEFGTHLNAPSWVPNWNNPDKPAWIHSSLIYEPIIGYKSHQRPVFEIRNETIEIDGLYRGTVLYCTNAFPTLDGSRNDQTKLISLTFELTKLIAYSSRNMSSSSVAVSIQNALLSDQIHWGKEHAKRTDNLYDSFKDVWPLVYQFSLGLAPTNRTLNSSLPEISNLLHTHLELQTTLRKLCKRFSGKRTLFYCPPDFIGVGPASTREGDKITSIIGVSVPMVLRGMGHVSGVYKVVGPAFVDTLMEWGWFKRTKKVWETEVVTGRLPDGRPFRNEVPTAKWTEWPESEGVIRKKGGFGRIRLI